MLLRRTYAHDVVVGRDSQRISLRASQAQQLGRESLFAGFTYEPTEPGAAPSGRGPGLHASEDGLDDSFEKDEDD